jgi:hypothetical protein
MAPQVSSSSISEEKCKISNISTPDDLLDTSMKDIRFVKLGLFYFNIKQNIVEDGILPCTATNSAKLIFKGINLAKKLDERSKMKRNDALFSLAPNQPGLT